MTAASLKTYPGYGCGLYFDNSLGRAPPFIGNTFSAVGAFAEVKAYRYQNRTIEFYNLFTCDEGSRGTLLHADTALDTRLGNFISHFSNSFGWFLPEYAPVIPI
jgi:hypothetical protein